LLWERADVQPPLKKLEQEHVQLISDKTKFIQFIDLHKQKHEKLRQAIDRTKAAIADQGESAGAPVVQMSVES
jgi:hypothetical protein